MDKKKRLIKQYKRLWKLKNVEYMYEKGNKILKELKQLKEKENQFVCVNRLIGE